MSVALNKVIADLDKLSADDKEYVKDIIDRMVIEARREEIYQNGQEARQAVAEGKVKFGSAADLLKDLNADWNWP